MCNVELSILSERVQPGEHGGGLREADEREREESVEEFGFAEGNLQFVGEPGLMI